MTLFHYFFALLYINLSKFVEIKVQYNKFVIFRRKIASKKNSEKDNKLLRMTLLFIR